MIVADVPDHGSATATPASDPGLWTPGAGLVADVRRALGAGPVHTPQARFERLAWLALLDAVGPALLTRAAAPAHLTASAAVLSPDATRTCLVLHRKLQRWVQPGGHFEAGDETGAGAAAREVREETGLGGEVRTVPAQLSRHRAPCAPGVVDWHLDIQYVLVTEPVPPRPSDETPQVAWFAVDDLPFGALASGIDELVSRAVEILQTPSA